MQVPWLVQMAKEALAEGKCVVIGLQSTGEARTADVVSEKGEELDDFVSGPRVRCCLPRLSVHLPKACSAQLHMLARAVVRPVHVEGSWVCCYWPKALSYISMCWKADSAHLPADALAGTGRYTVPQPKILCSASWPTI